MPTTYYDEDVVRRVIELRKRNWGYRRIGDAIGISKDAAMRIWKAYEEGRIRLRDDGTVEFVHKPAGVIKYQMEGLWDPRSRSYIKPPELKILPQAQFKASPESIEAHAPPEHPIESRQKVFKVKIPRPESRFFKRTLLTLHETLSTILPIELPPPPPAPPLSPSSVVQELLYVKLPCPNCGNKVYIKPPRWSYDVKHRVLCGNCGALIEVEFID